MQVDGSVDTGGTAGLGDVRAVGALAWSVAEAAARTGLTAATLRTWHRRYGLGPSLRTPGGHRRYGAEDLERLARVAALVESGVPPATATAFALATEPGERAPVRAGGGRVVPLPAGSPVQRGLARAALSLDVGAVQTITTDLFAGHGVAIAWQEGLVPVLRAMGDRWDRTGSGVEAEHVLSAGIAAALIRHDVAGVHGPRPVLLSCMPEEQHELPLLALRVALHGLGTPATLLGARVPPDALRDSVARIRPRCVVLWAHDVAFADFGMIARLPAQRPRVRVMLAGPGWQDRAAGPDALYPGTLPEALAMLPVA